MASPESLRTNNASDPLGAFDSHGRFYFGMLSYNGFAEPGTNADIDPAANGGYPIDYLFTTRVGQGTPSANFQGKFLDKPMLEVDRTGGRFDGNVCMCFHEVSGVRAERDLLRGLQRPRCDVHQAQAGERQPGGAGVRHRRRARR